MKKICVICGSDIQANIYGYKCMEKDCTEWPLYCFFCAGKHEADIRCPRHFLKSHREDVARYKKVRFE